jgi:hypothetical protein
MPDYRNPANRQFGVHASVDMLNLPTLPERMHERLTQALVFHLKDAAEAIIEDARLQLVPGHGYDTGLLSETLTYDLAAGLLATGVYYDLLSREAEYWQWVEFGHWVMNARQPWFWPGYHYLENAIGMNIPKITRSVRAAWADTAIALAAEARVPVPGMHPGGTSPLLRR